MGIFPIYTFRYTFYTYYILNNFRGEEPIWGRFQVSDTGIFPKESYALI